MAIKPAVSKNLEGDYIATPTIAVTEAEGYKQATSYDSEGNQLATPVIIVNETGSGFGEVVTVNDQTPDLMGNVELYSNKIELTETNPKLVSTALKEISDLMVTGQQLNLASLTDNIIPTEDNGAYSPIWDASLNVMQYHSLKQKGIGEVQEVRLKASTNQAIPFGPAFTEIEFDSTSSDTSGTYYTKSGNGIQINNIDEVFTIGTILSTNLAGKHLSLPYQATIKLYKNGVQSLQYTKEVGEGSYTFRPHFKSDEIPDLQVGDILTIRIAIDTASGTITEGKETFVLDRSRSFSAYYRSLELGGYFYSIADNYGDFLTIKKTDTTIINPNSYALTSFTPETATYNSDNITYDDLTKSFLLTPKSLASYDIELSLTIEKRASTGNVGKLEVIAFIEKWNGTNYEQYSFNNFGRTFVVANVGYSSSDFLGNLRIDEAGLYRIRFYFKDSGLGDIYNGNITEAIDLSTGENIQKNQVTTLTIRESYIH